MRRSGKKTDPQSWLTLWSDQYMGTELKAFYKKGEIYGRTEEEGDAILFWTIGSEHIDRKNVLFSVPYVGMRYVFIHDDDDNYDDTDENHHRKILRAYGYGDQTNTTEANSYVVVQTPEPFSGWSREPADPPGRCRRGGIPQWPAGNNGPGTEGYVYCIDTTPPPRWPGPCLSCWSIRNGDVVIPEGHTLVQEKYTLTLTRGPYPGPNYGDSWSAPDLSKPYLYFYHPNSGHREREAIGEISREVALKNPFFEAIERDGGCDLETLHITSSRHGYIIQSDKPITRKASAIICGGLILFRLLE